MRYTKYEDKEATLRGVAFVTAVAFDLCSFNVIQEEHGTTLDHTGAHKLDRRVFFRKEKFGNHQMLRHHMSRPLRIREWKGMPEEPTRAVEYCEVANGTKAAKHRGADVIGRCDFYVKTVLLILLEGFLSIFWFVGLFGPRSCRRLAFIWAIYIEIEIELLGIGIAVLLFISCYICDGIWVPGSL